MSSNCLAPEILPACIQVGQYTGDKFLQLQSGQQNLKNMATKGEITEQVGVGIRFLQFHRFGYFGEEKFWFTENSNRSVLYKNKNRCIRC